ncbi:hypothetical protein GCM10010503_02470 [Streptomyces lucensis JCM 4490]|uniref:Lipoprotein n=1 Tax=Streptomyces lucensis JCM 4490 TaxID=1306176 RepID=A0A918IST7_9ACTN|nr:hypothetical protein [Streptomyces lucensis]GGW30396.1 hypothetical protein GCM10010503_02470 [Streptomyces lucensis JCM 4490]
MAGRSVLCATAALSAVLVFSPAPPAAAHALSPAPLPAAHADTAAGALASPAAASTLGGDDGPSARALADEARDGLLAARSVHLRFTDHTATARRALPASMDLALDRDGNCAGRLVMGGGGGGVELIKRGDQVWMKPDPAFWKAQVPGRQGEALAEVLKDRYIHGSTHDMILRGMAGTCDLRAFQRQAASGSSRDIPLTKGGETVRDGVKVIPLSGTKNRRQTVLYVTSAAPHRLAEATQKGGGIDQTLTFRDYDAPVPSATPPAADSVDVSRLRQELRNT